MSNDYVTISEDGEITVSVRSLPEAKLALKELKLKKKELTLLKKQFAEEERQIRANYTEEVRNRGSKVQGLGKVGKFIRLFQTASRDARKRTLSEELAPFEERKRKIEAVRNAIEQATLRVETYILQNS